MYIINKLNIFGLDRSLNTFLCVNLNRTERPNSNIFNKNWDDLCDDHVSLYPALYWGDGQL